MEKHAHLESKLCPKGHRARATSIAARIEKMADDDGDGVLSCDEFASAHNSKLIAHVPDWNRTAYMAYLADCTAPVAKMEHGEGKMAALQP